MPRPQDIPDCPQAPTVRDSGQDTRTYTIELITPMFGGGVEAGVNDPSFPIRPTAIRGQLRFWWRATRGHVLADAMWQREEEIFGSTEFPSPLAVEVIQQPHLRTVEPTYRDRFGPIAYALFSAVENNQQVCEPGIRFGLRLRCDSPTLLRTRRKAQNEARKAAKKTPLAAEIVEIGPEIEAAVLAWCKYGGLGARTRRGAGAIRMVEPAETTGLLPPVDGKVFTGRHSQNALEAWKESVRVYQEFRQSPRGARHPKIIKTRDGSKTISVPGRSHWPEADSIRKITGCSLKSSHGSSPTDVKPDENPNDHSTPVVPAEHLPAFPKALLGLPINFHFADGPGKKMRADANRDPQDVQLVPLLGPHDGEAENRMASPVITRPLFLDGRWHPAVILLNRSLPDRFQTRLEGKHARASGGDLSLDIPLSKMAGPAMKSFRPMRGKESALDALTEFLSRDCHFEEIRP